MEKINYFNYSAFFTLVILITSTFYRKLTHGKRNFCFIVLMMTIFFTTISDIIAVSVDNRGDANQFVGYTVHTLYLMLHAVTMPIYVRYIIAVTDTSHKINKTLKFLIAFPFILLAVCLIINPFTSIMFSFENGVYSREHYYNIIYLVTMIYGVFGLIYLFKFRKLVNRTEFIALLVIFPIMTASIIFQMFYSRYRIELLANVMAVLFMSSLIQRPEYIIDTVTKLNKFEAYSVDVKRNFESNKSVSIIMINIANFEPVREILGYDGMNNTLEIISRNIMKINKKLKTEATLYYLDRGRFRVVIDLRKSNLTETVAEEINNFMKNNIEIDGMNINFITYICITYCPEDIADFRKLITFGNDLDRKFDYSGNVTYANSLLSQKNYNLMLEIDSIIDNALANDKFQVYYQPIYSVKENSFKSAEALLRLKDDKYGFISPDIFISAAEKNGTIHKIGAYVLESVCKFIASPDFKKLKLEYIEVNLSVAQFMNKNLADDIISIMKKYNVKPEQINLEITETAALDSQKIMTDNLNRLLQYNISFSLDDFGTGYSNMKRMASLPFKIVKLDKSFVNTNGNKKMDTVLESSVNMLKKLNMEIVVEGVETHEGVERFSEMQCEYIQGYYYSKPVPENEFTEFINNSLTARV